MNDNNADRSEQEKINQIEMTSNQTKQKNEIQIKWELEGYCDWQGKERKDEN